MLSKPSQFLSLTLVAAILLTGLCQSTQVKAASKSDPTVKSTEERAVKVSPRLARDTHQSDERVTVIVELNDSRGGHFNSFLKRNGVHLEREMKKLRTFAIEMPFSLVPELSAFPEVFHVSANERVSPVGHVTTMTGADAGRVEAAADGRGTIDGSGVGIAILDSGIDPNHTVLVLRWSIEDRRQC